ncbi:MAG: hypothetical protein RLY70_2466 [Planctomycetota bacterium]|jgi:hypothetical protein
MVTATLWRSQSSRRIQWETTVRAARRCSRRGLDCYPKVMVELDWQQHEQPAPMRLDGTDRPRAEAPRSATFG